MHQRRFWGKRRSWTGPRKRKPRTIALSDRGIYEPVQNEEDVVKQIIALLWYSGVPCFRERERVPVCPSCHEVVCRPSDAGHPDLHGWIPAGKFGRSSVDVSALPFYIECKNPKGGIASEVQKEFIRRCRRDGALAFFATGWKDVWWNFWGVGVTLPEA